MGDSCSKVPAAALVSPTVVRPGRVRSHRALARKRGSLTGDHSKFLAPLPSHIGLGRITHFELELEHQLVL